MFAILMKFHCPLWWNRNPFARSQIKTHFFVDLGDLLPDVDTNTHTDTHMYTHICWIKSTIYISSLRSCNKRITVVGRYTHTHTHTCMHVLARAHTRTVDSKNGSERRRRRLKSSKRWRRRKRWMRRKIACADAQVDSPNANQARLNARTISLACRTEGRETKKAKTKFAFHTP